jgi:hypothetical protein
MIPRAFALTLWLILAALPVAVIMVFKFFTQH